jgi:hypothetical protein
MTALVVAVGLGVWLTAVVLMCRWEARCRAAVVRAEVIKVDDVENCDVRANSWLGEGAIGGVRTSIRVTIAGGCKAPKIEGITWRRL